MEVSGIKKRVRMRRVRAGGRQAWWGMEGERERFLENNSIVICLVTLLLLSKLKGKQLWQIWYLPFKLHLSLSFHSCVLGKKSSFLDLCIFVLAENIFDFCQVRVRRCYQKTSLAYMKSLLIISPTFVNTSF